MAVQKFVCAWLLLSTIVVVWDAGFVLLRPRSLPGGDLHHLWKPYALYIEVDTRYGDMEDAFCIAQSLCNLAEVLLNLVAIPMLWTGRRAGVLLSFAVCIMTFWKTVIYHLLYTPLTTTTSPLGHLSWTKIVLLFIIPNGTWLLIPFLASVYLGYMLLQSSPVKKNKKH